ncbi:hypothetical protein SVIO_006250 [Streptomyces violaceusniger]|uniref:Uncharacterized protein n=1 Tax=Streptomyces violaceusniger TaxID=68280 RepID=A0A4D4KMY3_STRVO|nr:hypothetical protein SVIO_006250 [Streptomyces violaceusniger]
MRDADPVHRDEQFPYRQVRFAGRYADQVMAAEEGHDPGFPRGCGGAVGGVHEGSVGLGPH